MASEKTEEATPDRVRQARREGQVATSPVLQAGVVLLAVTAVASLLGAYWVSSISSALAAALQPSSFAPKDALQSAAGLILRLTMPLALTAAFVGVVVGGLQSGGLWAPGAVFRNSPVRFPSLANNAREAGKSTVYVLIVLAVGLTTLHSELRFVLRLAFSDSGAAISVMGRVATSVLWRVSLAVFGLGIVDYLIERRRYLDSLRMSRDEVRREQKNQEGDPLAKQERDRRARENMEASALERIDGSSIVVASSDGTLVALYYDGAAKTAPTVRFVAAGVAALAARDRAENAGIPFVEDNDFVLRVKSVDIDSEIPEEAFEAAARLLKHAYAARDLL